MFNVSYLISGCGQIANKEETSETRFITEKSQLQKETEVKEEFFQKDEEVEEDAERVLVQGVVDGDTFVTSGGMKVRMIGVDTPESVKPNSPVEPYGKEANSFTKSMIEGKTVYLTHDVEPKDQYGRTLAYIFLEDGTFFNEYLVREGYAQVMTIAPSVKYAGLFLEAQRYSRENNKGLWGLSETV